MAQWLLVLTFEFNPAGNQMAGPAPANAADGRAALSTPSLCGAHTKEDMTGQAGEGIPIYIQPCVKKKDGQVRKGEGQVHVRAGRHLTITILSQYVQVLVQRCVCRAAYGRQPWWRKDTHSLHIIHQC